MVRTLGAVFGVFALLAPAPSARAQAPGLQRIAPASLTELRQWNQRLEMMLEEGTLRLQEVTSDRDVAGRTHQRLVQLHRGVPVFGATLTRQLDGDQVVSLFGTLHPAIDIDVTPALSASDAARVLAAHTGQTLGPSKMPTLTILRLDDPQGRYVLAWQARVATLADVTLYFVDARTGRIVKQRSDAHRQAAVGRGTGVLGDTKKMSVRQSGAQYLAEDLLRPPRLVTFDMRGDVYRFLDILNGRSPLLQSDLAADTDNAWTDAPAVDAHAYAGYTYDYLFKRFGRKGLDNRDAEIYSFVHLVRRQDLFTYPDDIIGTFYLNAFYCCGGVMVYGEGIPAGYTFGGQVVDYQAGALDVIAHELAHGVTDYTSALDYEGESGALNEAFSDIIGTSVEFFFQTPGTGLRQADYLIAEDTWRPGGIRSMADPGAFGDPDHYSRRYTGAADNGGVHINAGIANQAFYLAVEGGTNRTSGQTVTGVGAATREQIEKIFYRAFTALLPASATFSMARAATIQAARDLYAAGSAAERAVMQAWSAVGVN